MIQDFNRLKIDLISYRFDIFGDFRVTIVTMSTGHVVLRFTNMRTGRSTIRAHMLDIFGGISENMFIIDEAKLIQIMQ